MPKLRPGVLLELHDDALSLGHDLRQGTACSLVVSSVLTLPPRSRRCELLVRGVLEVAPLSILPSTNSWRCDGLEFIEFLERANTIEPDGRLHSAGLPSQEGACVSQDARVWPLLLRHAL